MRVCVISDIHGNAHALAAVLEAVDRESPDAVWCLGDVVGYGPRPNECCARIAGRADISLGGNHDLAVLGAIDLAVFSDDAAEAALWTRTVLEADSRDFLAGLAPKREVPDAGAELFHGSPRDPVWEYVLTEEAAEAALELTSAPLVLVGHSHVPLAVTFSAAGLEGGVVPGGTRVHLGSERCLLNPGSVGQPRDGDPRAAYLSLDLAARHADFRRVEYAVEETQAEIRRTGLPEPLAVRLAYGE